MDVLLFVLFTAAVYVTAMHLSILGGITMKAEILALRKLGHSISDIARLTGYSITDICEVIRAQNDEDIANDK